MTAEGTDRPTIVASTSDPAAIDATHADVVELRLDLWAGTGDPLDVYRPDRPVLLTDRSAGSADDVDRLASLLEHPLCWGVDVDLPVLAGDHGASVRDAADDLVERARRHDVTVVCSVHLDPGTAMTTVRDRLEETLEHGDVGKLAIELGDASALGDLVGHTQRTLERGDRVATMATGPYGPPSRLIATCLGCTLVYGTPVGAAPVAAGQVPVGRLRALRAALAPSGTEDPG